MVSQACAHVGFSTLYAGANTSDAGAAHTIHPGAALARLCAPAGRRALRAPPSRTATPRRRRPRGGRGRLRQRSTAHSAAAAPNELHVRRGQRTSALARLTHSLPCPPSSARSHSAAHAAREARGRTPLPPAPTPLATDDREHAGAACRPPAPPSQACCHKRPAPGPSILALLGLFPPPKFAVWWFAIKSIFVKNNIVKRKKDGNFFYGETKEKTLLTTEITEIARR